MKHIALLSILLAGAPALAAPPNVCVPSATGVPTREGPPHWDAFGAPATIPVDSTISDPRWVGSLGHAFAYGGATEPLQSRALYSSDGHLYLSFIVDIDPYTNFGNEAGRDIFVGFHRPSTTASGAALGYVLQFHLSGKVTAANGMQVAPKFCNSYASCDDEGGSAPRDYWRIFYDRGATQSGGLCGGQHVYSAPLASDSDHPPPSWISNHSPAVPDADPAVRYWKLPGASNPAPLERGRWAVQLRIPMIAPAPANADPLANGIERGSTFFYEAQADLETNANAHIGSFPEGTSPVCTRTDIDVVALASDPSTFAKLWLPDEAPTTCDKGISISPDGVGNLFNTALPGDLELFHPDWEFKSGGVNHVVALPFNEAATNASLKLMARFRLAGWGSAPWSNPTDHGVWKDIRPAANGVCADGTAPACNAVSIAAGTHGLVTFDWTIGSDTAGIAESEYCQFGLTPPAGYSCVTTGCAATEIRAVKTTGEQRPCVQAYYRYDECMLVELSTSDGSGSGGSSSTTFTRQSTWRNMTFGEMSTFSRTALIDARQLPVGAGQQFQDIYFVVMPRNLPPSVPAGTTGALLVQQQALAQANAIAKPYLADLGGMPVERKQRAAELVKRKPRTLRSRAFAGEPYGGIDYGGLGQGTPNDELAQRILEARVYMPWQDFNRVGDLLRVAANQGSGQQPTAQLTHDAASMLGAQAAATIVPTLEIYPYYRPMDQGSTYEPMTSFSVFLSHENTLAGMTYVIDGATRVGKNVYHLRIPIKYAKEIQVRAQALQPPEQAQPGGDPTWPNSGCICVKGDKGLVASLGGGAPPMLAGVLVIRRRRRAKS